MMLKLSLFALLALAAIGVNGQKKLKCNAATLATFDENVSNMIISGNANNTFPSDAASGLRWCSRSKSSIKHIKAYARDCLSSLTKQVINVLAYSMSKKQKSVCKSKETRNVATTALACINNNLDEIQNLMYDMIDDFGRIVRVDNKQKIPVTCCTFYNFRAASKVATDKVCSASDTKHYQDFVNSLVGEILELLCGDSSPGSDRCKNVKSELPAPDPAYKRTMSVVPPFLTGLDML